MHVRALGQKHLHRFHVPMLCRQHGRSPTNRPNPHTCQSPLPGTRTGHVCALVRPQPPDAPLPLQVERPACLPVSSQLAAGSVWCARRARVLDRLIDPKCVATPLESRPAPHQKLSMAKSIGF